MREFREARRAVALLDHKLARYAKDMKLVSDVLSGVLPATTVTTSGTGECTLMLIEGDNLKALQLPTIDEIAETSKEREDAHRELEQLQNRQSMMGLSSSP